jgi:prepilin-type N-terminal cleavage/methylation domain-containing protein
MPSAQSGPRRPSALVRHPAEGRGFTLLELLTVVTVIVILGGISFGAIKGAIERSKIARTRGELAALVTALEQFRQIYGDYPQIGEFGQAAATPTSVDSGPGVNTAQAKLFNCLTGVFGARAFANNNRISGPNLLEVGRFTINGTLTTQFLLPVSNTPNPPSKQEQNACLLDSWGRRYLYYYKNARSPFNWQATGYVLYSAGLRVADNGTQTPPLNVTTGLMLASQSAEMADNIYANP